MASRDCGFSMPPKQKGRPASGTIEGLGPVLKTTGGVKQYARYRVRFTGPDKLRHTWPVIFQDRDAALVQLANERKLIESDPENWVPPKDRIEARKATQLTFGDYSEAWLKGRKVKGRPLADRTRDHYRDLLDRFILPTFKDTPLTAITPDKVDHWYETVAVGIPTTQAHAYGLLRTILTTAVDRNLIKTANPAKVRGGGTAKRISKTKPASLKELAIIRAAVPERRRLMVDLAAWCALRFGELAELRRSDIDTKVGVIKVRRGVVLVRANDADNEDYDGPKYVRKTKTPKSDAGIRDVQIPPHLLGEVRAHLLAHAAPGRNGLLFPGKDPESHLTSTAFYGRIAVMNEQTGEITVKGHGYFEARRQAGRSDLRFHDLRHTGLTNAAVAGATLAELMELAGHSTSGAALRYQHASKDRMQDLAAKMSAMAEAGE